jgi:hypothetical protein
LIFRLLNDSDTKKLHGTESEVTAPELVKKFSIFDTADYL